MPQYPIALDNVQGLAEHLLLLQYISPALAWLVQG